MRVRVVTAKPRARIVARRAVKGSGHVSANAMAHVLTRTLRAQGYNAIYQCSALGIPYVYIA